MDPALLVTPWDYVTLASGLVVAVPHRRPDAGGPSPLPATLMGLPVVVRERGWRGKEFGEVFGARSEN